MSVSSLPEWKQLLLEKKRREEEERERREKEEEEKLASMPAWKRGIIQRRKAKQDTVGDREKERDMCVLQVDVRSSSDGLSDMDSSVTVNLGSEPSFTPDVGLWMDAEPKTGSQVSLETIVPVHENPFIRTQSAWRKGRDSDAGNEPEIKEKEKEKEKLTPKGQEVESGRGRAIGLKIERFRDLSEGRDKERSRDRSQGRERESSRERWEKDKNQRKDSVKDGMKERELVKVRKDEEEKETDPPPGSFSPHVPGLRTIRADNIIIIEQNRKGSDERRGRWREAERERERLEEGEKGKRGMKMDLRDFLAGGGSVTEIRASEVLIIKPSASPEAGKGREDGEVKCSTDVRRESAGRELRADMLWPKEKDGVKEKERPRGQATVIKEDKKHSLDDNVFVERGGRVSQLLSKFGEHPKPPSRSKSSDNFLRHGRRKYSGDEDDQQSEERKADRRNMLMKGVPKRSLSFSDRVISAKENGLGEELYFERKTSGRLYSEKSIVPWVDLAGLGRETTAKIKMGCARLLDKGRFKNEGENRSEVKKAEPIDKRAAEKATDAEGDEGFTVASVKNTEGISFARRLPIRQDGKTRAERDMKRQVSEEKKSLERELSVERDSDAGGQVEAQVSDRRASNGFESVTPLETVQSYITAASAEAESHYRHESAFTECSSLLCTGPDWVRDPHRGPEWSGTGPQGPYLTHSVLSQHTEDLISKIEKIGDTTVYSTEKGERLHRECKQDIGPESLIPNMSPRSPKRIAPMAIAPSTMEIQIPRTVFYVAEEMVERKKSVEESDEGQDWEGGQKVERRDSWRIGKPLSRIESLREKIRQRELEKSRQRETQDGEGSEAESQQTAADRYDDEREAETEWEAAAHTRKRSVESERGQEEAAAQTSTAAFDVTQEVDVLKTCLQLPVSALHSQAIRGEEVVSGYATAVSELISDSPQISEDEDDPLKHAEEQLRHHRGRHQSSEEEGEDKDEEKELSEEVEEYTSSLDPTQPLSPSPPDPNSLAAMSRIYNLETVGSRSGLCLRERTVDISPVHLVKVKPIISNAQQGDSKALPGEDTSGVQTIQRQIEQFQLKEQEALSCTSPNLRKPQSPRVGLKQQLKDDVKTKEKDQSESNYKMAPQRVCSPTTQVKQTITVNPSFLRNQQSLDNSPKPTGGGAPTPASSPSSPSPAQSPSVSPSPTPSPTLFSIRSASGGQVKRGATITITPKRPVTTGAGTTMTGSTPAGSTSAGSSPAKTPSPQAKTTAAATEPTKKKYPTAEEIVVIGGYQSLEKSCLVKNRGTPKKVKVCFDEEQLEQVCEYPSETSMLACTPYPHDLGRPKGEEEEAEAEGGAIVSKSTSNVGTTTGRGQRVDKSCPR